MFIEECCLPYANELVNGYINGEDTVSQFFDYRFQEDGVFAKRHTDIANQRFPRDELVNHLLTFNETYSSHPKVFENIRQLIQQDSAVVITGQQAGLLTGPLYTIYKAMTVIQLAQKYAKQLDKPVIPVFWVAGEDHDFQEINHLWTVENGDMRKVKFPQKQLDKRPVSEILYDQETMEKWIRQLFNKFGETDHTAKAVALLNEKAQQSESFSDFFIHVMAWLFDKYGLVFIDSANKHLRNIESEFFAAIIEKNEALQRAFLAQQERLLQLGYPSAVDTAPDCAHLFYHLNGERELLYRDGDGHFHNKNDTVQFSQRDLLKISKKEPEKLSNNVLTRPLMQDYLFPTLAVVAGPGEIAYWSYLQPLFKALGRKMPPVVPRFSVTIVERRIKKIIEEFHLNVKEIITSGIDRFKEDWLAQQKKDDIDQVLQETKHAIDSAHAKLRDYAWSFDRNIGKLSEKNRTLILAQIDFMKQRMEATIKARFSRELSAFEQVEVALFPNKGWQERSWNIFYYLNHYGLDFVDRLFEVPISNEYNHHLLYL